MKIDTTTILLIAVAAGAVYLITRPAAVPPPYPYPTTAYNPYMNPAVNPNLGNPTAQDISAGGQAAGTVINALSNLF